MESGTHKIRSVRRLLIVFVVIFIAVLAAGCTEKEEVDPIDDAAFQRIVGEYQAVEEDLSYWHVSIMEDVTDTEGTKEYDYFMSIYDNGAGNPGVEGEVVAIDDKTIIIAVDFEYYEGAPGDWGFSSDDMILEYTLEDNQLTLSNNGSKVVFAREAEVETETDTDNDK